MRPSRRLALVVLAVLIALWLAWPTPAGAQAPSTPGAPHPTFTHLTAGSNFTCALDADARAWCWGANFYGQLGRDTLADTCSDARLQLGACARRPVAVAGDLRFTAIAAGEHHACGIAAGAAWCWGGNHSGQLGPDGVQDQCEISWREFPPPPDGACSREPVHVPSSVRFTHIVAGNESSCALDEEGSAWCWGAHPHDTNPPAPVPLDEPLVSLAGSGPEDVCGLTAEGLAICWSARSFDYQEPSSPSDELRFASISVAPFHACALTRDGRAFCWGRNEDGEVGAGYAGKRQSVRLTAVAGGHRFRAIAASHGRTCAIDTGGALYCWGQLPEVWQRNVCSHDEYTYDARGNRHLATRPRGCTNRPRRMLLGRRVNAIALGPTHFCAIMRDGTSHCWGTNAWGELGDGTTQASTHPTPVMGPRPSQRQLVVADARETISGLLVRGGAAVFMLALVMVRSRPWIAERDRRGLIRVWGASLATVAGLWIFLKLVRSTALGGAVDALVLQPLIVIMGVTIYWIWTRLTGQSAATPVAAAPAHDPQRVRSARRLGAMALGAAVLGWMPALHLMFSDSAFEGLSGDVGLGLAWMMIFAAGGMVALGSVVAVILAVAARRRWREEPLAGIALGVGAFTAVCVVAALFWLEYYM